MNRKRIILRFLCAALLLSGLGLLLYPSVNAWLEKRKIGQHVEAFRNTVTALQQSGGKAVSATATMEESAPPYAELLEAMEAYNESIFADKQAGFCDPWSYQAPVFDLAEYGIEDGIVGILSIPKMDLELPIYLGATAEHLASGAAQLSQTSTELVPGDRITITNLWETLTYTVSEIKVIEPNEIDEILIQPGRDLVTLLTCHPYGSGGRYRYIVYCEYTA